MAEFLTVDPATGQFVLSEVSGSGKGSGVTDDALALGNLVLRKSGGHVGKFAGASEADAAAIEGIADGTYAGAATAAFWREAQLATGLSGLTPGTEYWAKEDGTLALYSAVASGTWTRPIGIAVSATELLLRIGDVEQKP